MQFACPAGSGPAMLVIGVLAHFSLVTCLAFTASEAQCTVCIEELFRVSAGMNLQFSSQRFADIAVLW